MSGQNIEVSLGDMGPSVPDFTTWTEYRPDATQHQDDCRIVARALGVENGTAFSADTRNHTSCVVSPASDGGMDVKISNRTVAVFAKPTDIPVGKSLWCKITGGYEKNGTVAPYWVTIYVP